MLVSGAESLTEDELFQYTLTMCPQLTKQNARKLSSLIRQGQDVIMDTRAPVILCLDKVSKLLGTRPHSE